MGLIPWRNKGVNEEKRPASLRREFDRLFERFLGEPQAERITGLWGSHGWTPLLDLAENDEKVTLCMELPGIDPAEVEIHLAGWSLTIAGERREQVEENNKSFRRSERRLGYFKRIVQLPRSIDRESLTAEYKHGLLTLTAKKKPREEERKIPLRLA